MLISSSIIVAAKGILAIIALATFATAVEPLTDEGRQVDTIEVIDTTTTTTTTE